MSDPAAGAGRRQWRARRWVVATGALLCVVAVAVLLVGDHYYDEPAPWSDPEVAPGGRSVEIGYLGGSCDSAGRVEVDEDEDSVMVSVYSRVSWFVTGCDDMGVGYRVVAHLDAPLGRRDLVDGNATNSRR